MSKTLLTLLVLLFTLTASAKILDESISVNPHALPGDSEKNSMMLQGLRLHEANDFYGRTDKLVTEQASLTLMGVWKHLSSSLSYKGRYVTPVIRPRNGKPKLDQPIGIFAEWEETYFNQSITLYNGDNWGLKLDGGVGYNDFGPNGFTNLYKKIHRALGDDDESGKFGTRLTDNFISNNYGGSLIWGISEHINFLASYDIFNSKIYRENTAEGTLIYSISKDFAFSAKYSFIDQKRSDYYELRNSRQQWVLAARLFKFWTPSFMYVSPYVKGDNYGQWYLSPASFTWVF